MILKIGTKDGWHFFDNIKEIDVEMTNCDQFNNKHADGERYSFSQAFLHYHRFDPDGKLIFDKDVAGRRESSIVKIAAFFHDGSVESYLADLKAYLLSDEGRTVEGIN